MKKLTHRERRDLVCSLFLRNSHGNDQLLRTIGSLTQIADRTDGYARLLMNITPHELAIIGKQYYIFNGVYYEPIDANSIKYGVNDFLYSIDVKAKDRKERDLCNYMLRIIETIKDHVLSPRISLMCFTNCVMDFNTMKKYKFSPDLDVVKQYPFAYDRKQILKCHTWNAFIGERYLLSSPASNMTAVLPEKDKRRVLQMFLGACLVDRRIMNFEYFLVMQGVGANGKSVINRVLASLFGDDEMLNIKMSQFSRSGDEGLRAIAAMSGKRMLHCTESNKTDFKDNSILKALSSGEPMAGRHIGQNISTIVSPPLLVANSNYRWRKADFATKGDNDDISVQRRAVIINFDKTIPIEKRDALLSEKLKSERAGIFAWIVKGLEELRYNNWRLPEICDSSIDDYLDKLHRPIDIGGGKYVDGGFFEWMRLMSISHRKGRSTNAIQRTPTEIHEMYVRWCEDLGIEAVSLRKIGLDLTNLKFEKARGDAMVYTLHVSDPYIYGRIDTYIPKATFDGGFTGEELNLEDFVGNGEKFEMGEREEGDASPKDIE